MILQTVMWRRNCNVGVGQETSSEARDDGVLCGPAGP